MSGKKSKEQIEDLHLHFIVLLTIIIEKIEELEETGALFGKVKNFLKSSLKYFDKFMKQIYDMPDEKTAYESTEGVFVLQERVENALENKYVLTTSEREKRLTEFLYDTSLSEDEIHQLIEAVDKANILKH